jgi:chemotaxis protein methyltransferase CheR
VQRVRSERAPIEGLEISHNFPRIGQRILLLDACTTFGSSDGQMTILLGIEDVTEVRAIEENKRWLQKHNDDLLQQRELMVREMQHRIVNSLQIIASILMLKARAVTSEETRQHLQDAHRRVLSVAAVQQHLHTSLVAEQIDIAPYLQKLCTSLAESMIGESRPVALKVVSDNGTMTSAEAVSVGLIVTELVINALKYAFPGSDAPAAITVRYEVNGTDWKLSVSDNGVGRLNGSGTHRKGGLGTSLVNALAHQLDARVDTEDGPAGLSVAIAHATFTRRPALATNGLQNKTES